jgi:hypothetical protein
MSKIMHAKPIWLEDACANKEFLSTRLAVILNNSVEHLHSKTCGNLKYVQIKFSQYKHPEALCRKSDEFVQETLFSRGGKYN